jgi:hypothetical protein
MEVEMHNEGGFTLTKHHVQDERGHYKEPISSAHTDHGSLMDHFHEAIASHGHNKGEASDCACAMCEPDSKEAGAGEKRD